VLSKKKAQGRLQFYLDLCLFITRAIPSDVLSESWGCHLIPWSISSLTCPRNSLLWNLKMHHCY